MKIDLNSIDKEQFVLKEGSFCGVDSILITPCHVGCKWTQANRHLRSSIWDKHGQLLSGNFFKFVNMGENPENFPVPKSLEGSVLVDKIDGSLVGIDYLNGQVSMRTRGTFSYKTLENAADFEYCLSKYPNIISWIKGNPNNTLLFEITTPNLKIVLDYGNEPDFTLIGCVNKDDYSLKTQAYLDLLGVELGVKRPKSYTFDSISEMVSVVEKWQDREGLCWYHSGGNQILKIKANFYLKLHRFKEHCNLDTVFELFCSYGFPSEEDFKAKLTQNFDYECAKMSEILCQQVLNGYEESKKIKAQILAFTEPLKLVSRKEAAQKIVKEFGVHSSFAFQALDGKTFDRKKLLGKILFG